MLKIRLELRKTRWKSLKKKKTGTVRGRRWEMRAEVTAELFMVILV